MSYFLAVRLLLDPMELPRDEPLFSAEGAPALLLLLLMSRLDPLRVGAEGFFVLSSAEPTFLEDLSEDRRLLEGSGLESLEAGADGFTTAIHIIEVS